jgi:hypothetical protein
MLKLVASKSEKAKAQIVINKILLSALKSQGKQTIGYPGGSATLQLFSNGDGKIWYCSKPLLDEETPRFWNAFGLFDSSRVNQTITVEINIAIGTNNKKISGFLARDIDTHDVYLMHSGRIGGGTEGIGKSGFLAWTQSTLVPVFDEQGSERLGIAIGSLNKNTFVGRITRFVEQVATFKKLAKSGQLDTPEFRDIVSEFERFTPEFSGRKTGQSGGSIDYFSYHGDIVSELHRKRSLSKSSAEVIFNNGLIDLGVRLGDRLLEVYEVKTTTDRQVLYTAIGQLMVHSASGDRARKFLVVPDDDLPNDIRNTLKMLAIKILRFSLKADGSGVVIKN